MCQMRRCVKALALGGVPAGSSAVKDRQIKIVFGIHGNFDVSQFSVAMQNDFTRFEADLVQVHAYSASASTRRKAGCH